MTAHIYAPGPGGWCLTCGGARDDQRHVRSAPDHAPPPYEHCATETLTRSEYELRYVGSAASGNDRESGGSSRDTHSAALRSHVRYAGIVLRHKWFVLVAGRRTGVPLWRLLIHDLSKFSPAEWGPYRRRFANGRGGAMDHSGDPDEWHRAWNHHWHRNPHHWEHWLRVKTLPNGIGRTEPLAMPETYVREMVADWMGAGRAYTGTWDAREWYGKNRDRIVLHAESRGLAECLLAEVAL